VGNRQLLSGFFIVVLLFAVAFAMGYVVGENSRSAKTQAEAQPPARNAAVGGESRPQPASEPAQVPEPPPQTQPADTAKEPPSDAPPQPVTQPAREAQAPAPAPPAAVAPPETVAEPAPGSYWQVLSTPNRESAQTLAQSLREKGFPALLSPGPNNFTRVLVGPYADTSAMGRAKADLENAGFNRLVTFKR
jgi:cell division septation protein DedD